MEDSLPKFVAHVIKQDINYLVVSWDEIPDADAYKVERHFKTGEWKTACWCSIPPGKVLDLEENFGYKLQVIAMKYEEDVGFIPCAKSEPFVGCTLLSPPSTIAFYRAIKRGEQFLVKRLIQKRPILTNLPSPNGYTPLANAIALGELDIVDSLLTASASVHEGNHFNKRTPLHMAFYYGYLPVARVLLNKKADLNARDCMDMTPSHYAVDGEHFDVLKFALENNCDKEGTDSCGWTLLQRSIAMNRNLNIVKLLVSCGCKLDVLDNNKKTCLDIAKTNRNKDVVQFIESCLDQKHPRSS